MELRITLHMTFVLPFRIPFRVPAFRLSQLPKVTCYLQFNTCNWTGDQQCTVSGSRCYEHPNPATVSGDLNKLGCPWCYQDKLSEHSSKWSTQSIFNRKLHVSPVFSHMILGLFLPAVHHAPSIQRTLILAIQWWASSSTRSIPQSKWTQWASPLLSGMC